MHLLCNLLGHTRNKRKVRAIGRVFGSTCKRCGAPLMREATDAVWRLYDPVEEPLIAHWEAVVGTTDFRPRRPVAKPKGSRAFPGLRTDKHGRVVRGPASELHK